MPLELQADRVRPVRGRAVVQGDLRVHVARRVGAQRASAAALASSSIAFTWSGSKSHASLGAPAAGSAASAAAQAHAASDASRRRTLRRFMTLGIPAFRVGGIRSIPHSHPQKLRSACSGIATRYPRPDARGDRPAGDAAALGRAPRDRLRRRGAAGAAAVLQGPLLALVHARRRADARVDRGLVRRAAAVRALLRPARGALARARRRHRGRGRDRARRRRAVVLARGRARRRLRARDRRVPSRGVEVRRVRERTPAGERDVRVLDRRQPRVRARADRRRRARGDVRAARRSPARGPVRRDRARARRGLPLPRVVRAPGRRRDGAADGRAAAARARDAARRDHAALGLMVRADHVRAAVGGVARPLEEPRHAPPLADAARRRARHGRRRAGRGPLRPPAGPDGEHGRRAAAPDRVHRRRRRPRRDLPRARRRVRDRHVRADAA